jgi:hypothetical protein
MKRSLNVMRVFLAAAAAALVVTEAGIPTANAAAGPETTRFSFEDNYVDTYTCTGTSLDTRLEGHVVVQALSETRVQAHQRLLYTVTANGKTVTDNESFTNFTDLTSGVQTFAGTVVNIQVPGYGNVLADTGVLIVDFTTNPPTVLHVGGHHLVFDDGYGALCEYLAS